MLLLKRKIFIYMLFLVVMLSACEKQVETNDVSESTIFFVEPANQFAVDKETEIETIEPTKAHREYPSDFKLSADTEVVIGERQFLTKINYIYNNIEKFANSSIIIEGMYGIYKSWDETFEFPMVYRNGPALFGDDQYGGFYLVNINQGSYKLNDWIKVKGKPFIYEHTDSEGEIQKFLFLVVENIDVLTLKDRKAEMVND
ncbi:MAG: hypothetical protein J6P02_06155 [Lachnospiraceae bacterium]|nr:hypothetical protein [Lachnospiraceae bacterium]